MYKLLIFVFGNMLGMYDVCIEVNVILFYYGKSTAELDQLISQITILYLNTKIHIIFLNYEKHLNQTIKEKKTTTRLSLEPFHCLPRHFKT